MRPGDHPRCPDCGSLHHLDACGDTTLRDVWKSALAQVKAPDLDALLARADHHVSDECPGRWARCKVCRHLWPCEVDDLAAAVRTLRTDYDTALNVIRRLRTGWTDMPMGAEIRWCREGPTEDDPTTIRRWEPMSDAERVAVLAAAETRHQEQT